MRRVTLVFIQEHRKKTRKTRCYTWALFFIRCCFLHLCMSTARRIVRIYVSCFHNGTAGHEEVRSIYQVDQYSRTHHPCITDRFFYNAPLTQNTEEPFLAEIGNQMPWKKKKLKYFIYISIAVSIIRDDRFVTRELHIRAHTQKKNTGRKSCRKIISLEANDKNNLLVIQNL